jgi:hypothetical protein
MDNVDNIINALVKVANGDAKPEVTLNTKVGIETDSIVKICLGLFIVLVLAFLIFIVAFRSTQP